MSSPVLSVVIPSYNRARYLPACIDSVRHAGVLAQIIVVDDGSTDNTPDVVTLLGSIDYIRQANAGVAAARNRGLAQALGRYVAFLDSDDTWRPHVVDKLIDGLENCPTADVAFADAMVHDSASNTIYRLTETRGRHVIRSLPHEVVGQGLRMLDQTEFFHCMIDRNQVFLGSAVVRTEAARAIGGFDIELQGAADFEFMLRLSYRGPFLFLDQPLADYIKHGTNMSADLDHMDQDFALVFQKLLVKCSLNEMQRILVRRQRRRMLYYLAYNAFHRGELELARNRFRDLGREFGWDANSLALSALCRLPAGIVRRIRNLRRFLTRAS